MNKVIIPSGSKFPLSFQDKENRCLALFDESIRDGSGFWHLCTPGNGQQIIFSETSDYEIGMVVTALCLRELPEVTIITFELMSNHVHFILHGPRAAVDRYFKSLKARLQLLLKISGRMVDLRGFIPNIIAIESLESLRNQIVYTNRNNYVVDPDQTPFSYPYGANGYFFNPAAKASFRCNYGNLTARERRAFVHSHDVNYPDTYLVTGNYFSPVSYCDIDFGEAMFRDARHYFQKVSRAVEAFKEIAALTGDNVFYTDDELFAVASAICKKKYANFLKRGTKTRLFVSGLRKKGASAPRSPQYSGYRPVPVTIRRSRSCRGF
ncbi:MAG: hypothetical protein IKO77_00455 [Bacteroidales bacterium]|nr:hypothetical protein [Bacteroidales bacterium]